MYSAIYQTIYITYILNELNFKCFYKNIIHPT